MQWREQRNGWDRIDLAAKKKIKALGMHSFNK